MKVITQPKHGKWDGGFYGPNLNYLGKDTVVILVEGVDKNGSPFSVLFRYYINVNPKEYRNEVDVPQSIKKYCGAINNMWRISSTDSYQLNVVTNFDLDTRKLLVNSASLATQTIGLTTDNGNGSKTITLDDNGAGYGWYSMGADVASMLSDWSSQMASVFMDSLGQYLNPVGNYVSGAVPAAAMGKAFTSLDWQKESLMIG